MPNVPVRSRLAAALIAALALAGCSKRLTAVDPLFTVPEGSAGASSLVVYPDLATYVDTFLDFAPPGPDPGDQYVGRTFARIGVEGSVHGVVFDHTAANGYQVLRSEAGGGLRALKDFLLNPSARYLDTGWETYAFDDAAQGRITPTTYVARGAVNGTVGETAPVTNPGVIADTLVDDLPVQIVPTGALIDSAFTLRWTAVPGAAGYWLHVYQFRSDLRNFDEQLLSGVPAPVYIGKSRDVYLALLPPAVTTYRLGDPATILTNRGANFGQVYLARVSAVDTRGHLIASTRGDFAALSAGLGYVVWPLGAKLVEPGFLQPQTRALPAVPGFAGERRVLARDADRVARANTAMVAARGAGH